MVGRRDVSNVRLPQRLRLSAPGGTGPRGSMVTLHLVLTLPSKICSGHSAKFSGCWIYYMANQPQTCHGPDNFHPLHKKCPELTPHTLVICGFIHERVQEVGVGGELSPHLYFTFRLSSLPSTVARNHSGTVSEPAAEAGQYHSIQKQARHEGSHAAL